MNLNKNFILTKEYKRFSEFCRACHRESIIGLCYGPPGVGKTASAIHFSNWNEVRYDIEQINNYNLDFKPLRSYDQLNSIIYTPDVSTTALKIGSDIQKIVKDFNEAKEISIYGNSRVPYEFKNKQYVEIIIIDEVDRLQPKALEEIRDLYDRKLNNSINDPQLSLILIGMPGIEKRLIRFPQLYSRIGFVHSFKPLCEDEIKFIIQNECKSFGIDISLKDFADSEAISTISLITNGNFRLINRLLKQSIRVMNVNQLKTISKEVVEAARECLVIGNL